MGTWFQVSSQLTKIVNKVTNNAMGQKNDVHQLKQFYNTVLTKRPLWFNHQFFIEFYGDGVTTIYQQEWSGSNNLIVNPTYWIKASSIPAIDVTPAKVSYLAQGFEVPGVVKYPDSWDVTFMLDQQLSQYKFLQLMQRYMSSFEQNGGGVKVIPDIKAKVWLLDSYLQNPAGCYIIQGIFVTKLGDIQFEYSQGASQVKEVPATFAMQYFYNAGPSGTDNADPLHI